MDEPYHHTGRPLIERNSYFHCCDYPLLDFLENYNIDLYGIKNWINQNKFNIVGINIPTLMYKFCFDFANYLREQLNVDVIISGDPCFGACDVKAQELLSFGAQGIIHFGNEIIPNIEYLSSKIYFVPLFMKTNLCDILSIAELRLKYDHRRSIGIVSSIQYINNIPIIEHSLNRLGFEVEVGCGDSRIMKQGQVLGCNISSAIAVKNKVDCFVFFENGNFHAKAVCIGSQKDVYCFDPFTKKVRFLSYYAISNDEKEKNILKREIMDKGRKVGVIASNKIGQKRRDLAIKIINKLKNNKIKSNLIIANYIHPGVFANIDVDYYISTACPRISLDELDFGGKPILNCVEVIEYLNGFWSPENIYFDQISENN